MDMRQVPEQRMALKLTERLDEILWRKDFEFCEVVSGLAALGWGIWLAFPWDTFSSTASFRVMDALMPEPLWAAVMLWIGITQLGALYLDHRKPRRWSALGAVAAWAFIAVMLGSANWRGTGVIVYPVLTLCAAWAYLRLGRLPLLGP